MSRIGNKSVVLPLNVDLSIAENGLIAVEGPRGALTYMLPMEVEATLKDGQIYFSCLSKTRKAKALHGLARALISNMVRGVSQGFSKELEIQGVGFKAAIQSNVLRLNLGYSHEVSYRVPNGVKIAVSEGTKLRIEGIDSQLVGQVAANIRQFYPPEPYKGKGVRYVGEKIIRKEGKTVQ